MKNLFALTALALMFAGCGANVSKTESYVSSGARMTTAFNDGWRFRKGPFAADSSIFENHDEWEAVAIPHTWNDVDMQTAMNQYYAGAAGYAKTFTPDESLKDKRVFLRFEGVGSVADVYVNRRFAGNHLGAYSAFAVEITNLLNYGEPNTIVVRANNEARRDVIPVNHTLFGVYGGMYRPVSMIVTDKLGIAVNDFAGPGIYIDQLEVSDREARIAVRSKIENAYRMPQQIRLVTSIYDGDGMLVARRDDPQTVTTMGRQTFSQEFTMRSPRLWQGLEDPYLYRVVVQTVVDGEVTDEVSQPLGLRRFELRAADGMYLNGKKVPMYGVCRHQDRWGYGSALSDGHHREDLEIIRDIGATTIRFAHYQQAETIYALCDSIGFIVWAEIPFVNRVTTEEANNAKQQLIELLRQNYNHPSIYVWGLHNEVYSPDEYTSALTATLHDLAKSEDPFRYTVSVSGYSQVDRPTNLHADIQGINHYFGWYNGKIRDVKTWVESMERDFPGYMMMFSEYGAEANIDQQEEVVGDFGRWFSQFYPETFATRFHEIHWGVIREHPYLVASYIWNMFDFATPATTQGGVEARNMKGLVTFDRKVRKDPYYWYKAHWNPEPMVYLTQRRAVERENRVTPVTVYSNAGRPTLVVNGREISDFVIGETPIHYIFNDVELREGENVIVARVTTSAGAPLEDTIVWNYSPVGASYGVFADPTLHTKEHVGL